MLDKVSVNRSFSIQGKATFHSKAGGLLTIFLIPLCVVIFFLNGGFSEMDILASVQIDLTPEDISSISPPPIKIIYGFPKSLYQKLDVVGQKDGVRTSIPLFDYTDEMWSEFFNTTKNLDFIYKYHSWQPSSFIEVVLKTSSKNESIYTQTPF